MAKSRTNELTSAVLNYMNMSGYKVWRNNTIGVWDAKKGIYRKNKGQLKGVSDIIGYRIKDCKFVAIEIKTGRDKLSADQKKFLLDVELANGIALEIKNIEQLVKCLKE